MPEDPENETRVSVNDVPARLMMALDLAGRPHFLRCDKDGFLLCKVAEVGEEEMEVAEDE